MFLRASHFENTYMICFHLALMPKISQCSSATDKGSKSLDVNRAPGSCQCSQPPSHTNLWTASLDWIRRSPWHAGWEGSPVPLHGSWGLALLSPPGCWLPICPADPQDQPEWPTAAKLVATCRDQQSQGWKEGMGKIMNGAEDSRKIFHQQRLMDWDTWFISSVQKHQQQLHQS